MPVLSKLIFEFNSIFVQIPKWNFLMDLEKLILKLFLEKKMDNG